MSASIKTFCLAHKPIIFPLPDQSIVIWAGDGSPSALNSHPVYRVGDIAPEFETWHPFLGGSSGTFAIVELLRTKTIPWETGDCVNIVQFRKFVSKSAIGRPTNYPGMYAVDGHDIKNINWQSLLKDLEYPFLLPSPLEFRSSKLNVFTQYSSSHHASDILRYMAIAVEFDLLSTNDVWDLFNSTDFSPGGTELGVMPIEFYISANGILRIISEEFIKRHLPQSRDLYQRRAVSFCNERLGSFLINKQLKEIYNGSEPNGIRGTMHVISEDGLYRPG